MRLVGFIITIYHDARSTERLQHVFIFRDKYSSFPEFISFNKNGNNWLKNRLHLRLGPNKKTQFFFFDKDTDNCYYKQSNFTCSVMIATHDFPHQGDSCFLLYAVYPCRRFSLLAKTAFKIVYNYIISVIFCPTDTDIWP